MIRREGADDRAAVAGVHALAFASGAGQEPPAEVALVEALRTSPAWQPRLSLVAVDGGTVVGHVVCTRATIGPQREPVLGLGPVGVVPDRQRQGWGTALTHAVLAAAEALDEPLVGVLGEPAFYERFGFQPARRCGVTSPDPTWGDFFQVRALTPAGTRMRGRFAYAPAFEAAVT